jgi:ABC-type branched-subunit amino acid transport system substrate-binding protein
MRSTPRAIALSVLVSAGVLAGCGGGGDQAENGPRGVDLENKVVRIGLINDLSGPAAVIGRPMQVGYEVLYKQVNAGGSGILPEGWTVDWVTRDHGYNPQQSVQMYNEIHDDVFLLGLSFGTATTLPLHPMLARDGMVAFPASLSSRTGRNELTPVVTQTYRTEAMRAVDWAVEQGGPGVKIGIVYQQDDYGMDSLEGLEAEAEFHGVEVVSTQAIAAGQADFTAVVSGLESSGAEYVLLGILPSATGPLLGTAAQLGYEPVWIGNSPAWLDRFFDPDVIPPEVFANYHWAGGGPYWGEEIPGMATFLEEYERYGRGEMEPDSYILSGYLFGRGGLEVVRRALEAGDLSREGLLAAIQSIDGWDLGGLSRPISLTTVPYDANRSSRILRPIMDQRTWEVVSDFAVPQSDAGQG